MDGQLERLKGESDAGVVARRVALQLDGRDDQCLGSLIQLGQAFVLMIGDHGETGFCWCQPSMVPCESGASHSHPEHSNTIN